MNSYAVYYDAGLKAGRGAKVQDWSFVNHWSQWFRSAKALEKGLDKSKAQTAWDQGYHAGRNV